jgi:hypothetical protein
MNKIKPCTLLILVITILSLTPSTVLSETKKDYGIIELSKFTQNKNWLGKELSQILEKHKLEKIIIIKHESSAPATYMAKIIEELWQSKANLGPKPAIENFNKLNYYFECVLIMKNEEYFNLKFGSILDYDWGCLTSKDGYAYFDN